MAQEKPSLWNRGLGLLGLERTSSKSSRADSFQNSFLGYGTGRDKLEFGSFAIGAKLQDNELHALYYFDDIGAKIVNKRPAEMMRRGHCLRSKKNPDRAAQIQKDAEALDLNTNILRGMQWGRLWGGALMVLGALDGSDDLEKPLNEKSIRKVEYLNTVDRRLASVYAYQEDPRLPRWGLPEVYSVGGMAGIGAVTRVHASRVIAFDGVAETDPLTRRRLGGWTYSTLQRPYEIVRDFASSYKSVAHLISDASQGVWKIDGLLDMIANNRDELITRMQFSDMTRSAGRAIMLDTQGEDFERVATSFAGLSDVLDRLMMRLAAAAGMPVTELMGRSAAGMNATGEGDKRSWYDELETDQKNELAPILLGVYKLLASAEGGNVPDDLEIEFNPLWQPTEAEKATTAKTVADTDKVYNDMGLPGEAILIARFGSGEGKIEIDEEAMRISLDHEVELMKDPEARAKQEALANQAAIAGAKGKPDASKQEPSANE